MVVLLYDQKLGFFTTFLKMNKMLPLFNFCIKLIMNTLYTYFCKLINKKATHFGVLHDGVNVSFGV